MIYAHAFLMAVPVPHPHDDFVYRGPAFYRNPNPFHRETKPDPGHTGSRAGASARVANPGKNDNDTMKQTIVKDPLGQLAYPAGVQLPKWDGNYA